MTWDHPRGLGLNARGWRVLPTAGLRSTLSPHHASSSQSLGSLSSGHPIKQVVNMAGMLIESLATCQGLWFSWSVCRTLACAAGQPRIPVP